MKDRFGTVRLRGIAASPGLACGISFLHHEKIGRIRKEEIQSNQVKSEISRLNKAISKSRKELEVLRNEARNSIGTELSKIFDAEMMILEDENFMMKVKQGVVAKLQNVEYVFQQEVNKTIRALSRAKDEYMREMISDINAVSTRLLHNLSDIGAIKPRKARLSIIAFAPFFSPGEIMNMRKHNVVGFVTETGGATSHMVLFAKALGLPAAVGVKSCLNRVEAGQRVIVDGDTGEVIISPTPENWKLFKRKVDSQRRRGKKYLAVIGAIPSETIDGRKIEVMANLEIPTEYDEQLAAENISIGLYRTEFIYLNSGEFPDEEEQYEVYSKIARQFSPQPVTLRTFDLGGDKFTAHFKDGGESNPALGWRAIRFSLDVPKIFRTQLRAMLRASAHGNIRIMFPMISCVEQIVRAKRILSSIRRELEKQGIPFDNKLQIGIMIEIPSAVVMAHRLALEVDFFSIGTNDLTQYTLAVDRGNTKVAKWYREFHPAVMKFVAETVKAGHDNNIPVALCGELAGDPKATEMLVGFGLDSLSMNPGAIHSVKARIPHINHKESEKFAQKILSAQSANQIENILNKRNIKLNQKARKHIRRRS